jgi:hypothetical protein
MDDARSEVEIRITNKPKIDYGGLKLGVDYRRIPAESDATYLGNGNYARHREALQQWNTLCGVSELDPVMRSGWGLAAKYEKSTKTYIGISNDKSWVEIEFSPTGTKALDRTGFVVRLDINSGNPLVVDEDKKLSPRMWTRTRVMRLRNQVARLDGMDEIPTEDHPENLHNELLASTCREYTQSKFTDAVVGRHLTDVERGIPGQVDTQIAAAVTILSGVLIQGDSYSHYTESRWFGFVPSSLKKTSGDFQEDPVESRVFAALQEIDSKVRINGIVFEDGVYSIEDTQGEVVQIVTDGRSFKVELMKRETGFDKEGHHFSEIKDYAEMNDKSLISLSRHGLSGSRGWHGTPEDRRYVAERYLFRLNRSLYAGGFPMEASSAAALLEIEHKLRTHQDRSPGIQFAELNEDILKVIFPDGSEKQLTWKQLLALYTKKEKTEHWDSLGKIRRRQYPADDVSSGNLPTPDNFFNATDTEILIEEEKELPIYASDLPSGIIVQKLGFPEAPTV